MARSISERDWKVFRELRVVALERFCSKILDEARVEMERPERSAHERYLTLYKLIHKRDDDIARGFNDLRRSTALLQLGVIHSMGLFTEEELRRFSPDTLQILEMYASIPKD